MCTVPTEGTDNTGLCLGWHFLGGRQGRFDHGTILKQHLSTHNELFNEYEMKEKNNVASRTKVGDKINNTFKESQVILQFVQSSVKVNIDTKTLINACIERVTVNRRPYSIMDNTGFKKILDSILNSILFCIFSHIIKYYFWALL
jgi:hypothetical protein